MLSPLLHGQTTIPPDNRYLGSTECHWLAKKNSSGAAQVGQGLGGSHYPKGKIAY
ncbi:hypothetical protein [Flagellimonas marinaquae]